MLFPPLTSLLSPCLQAVKPSLYIDKFLADLSSNTSQPHTQARDKCLATIKLSIQRACKDDLFLKVIKRLSLCYLQNITVYMVIALVEELGHSKVGLSICHTQRSDRLVAVADVSYL